MRNDLRELYTQLGFTPSDYPSDIAATTTAAAVDLNGSDGKGVRIRNMDAANQIRIAFGSTSAEAITNAATGCVIDPNQMEILQPLNNNFFMGHRTVAGTASINYQPGW